MVMFDERKICIVCHNNLHAKSDNIYHVFCLKRVEKEYNRIKKETYKTKKRQLVLEYMRTFGLKSPVTYENYEMLFM